MRQLQRTVLICAVLLFPASANALIWKGGDLLKACSEQNLHECWAYLAAIADAAQDGPVAQRKLCIPGSATLDQMKDVVLGYLRKNPALQNSSGAALAATAFAEAFPCH